MALFIATIIIGLLVISIYRQSDDRHSEKITDETLPTPQIEFAPRHYICYRASGPVVIDGRLEEEAWWEAPWTEAFIDIEGELKPPPRFNTRAKMLWDDTYFYVAAEMEEPDVWATLRERDAVIYHDNDFEVFIDPDGDAHEYYELEVNAFNTQWDLLLLKPYRDGGPAVNAWDIKGLKTGVYIDGTLNKPGDRDNGWGIEIAFPWEVLKECAHTQTPPGDGDQWRINFSRVEWQTDIKDGRYVKKTDSTGNRILSEDNWVWSPQGLIALHYPEMWGLVQFSDRIPDSGEGVEFESRPEESAAWPLWRIYYAQRTHYLQYGRYTEDTTRLDITAGMKPEGYRWPPEFHITPNQFEASLERIKDKHKLHIDQTGRIWKD
ncbi:MAG: carbohydrate-binding family 9-like protein [candidate division Zixibacteria bacterium]|nr:carbohydrate-binding family 9-like protein [candidate division Zixibacteria bacterium]